VEFLAGRLLLAEIARSYRGISFFNACIIMMRAYKKTVKIIFSGGEKCRHNSEG
jgi:hypothetical protein